MRSAVRSISVLAGLVVFLTATVTVFAADAVPTVEVSGFVDGEGQPVAVESAKLEEFETADSEAIVTPIDVADDGTFTVFLREWGTPEEPAVARITVFAPPEDTEDEDGCVETIQLFGVWEIDVAGVVPTDPIVVVYNQASRSVLCPPVTATPEPDAQAPGGQEPDRTLPPTDTAGRVQGFSSIAGTLLVVGGLGLLAAASLLATRPTRRPSARTVSSTRTSRSR